MRRAVQILHALCLGWLLPLLLAAGTSEVLLRLILPVEGRFETWFTPGIEAPDPVFGFGYVPHYHGVMRHADRLNLGVPLVLDEHGFRLPNLSPQLPPGTRPRRILVMGGRSAIMSYGLSDDQSVTGRIAAHTHTPVEVHNTAWAGGSLMRNWHLVRHRLAGETFDLVLVVHVLPNLSETRDAQWWDTPPPPPDAAWAFRYMEGVVLWRDGLFAAIGRPAFASYTAYGWIRLADTAWKQMHYALGWSTPPDAVAEQSRIPDPADMQGYMRFLEHIRTYFAAQGTPVLFVTLPRKVFPADHHAPYNAAVPSDLDWIDLHARLWPELQDPKLYLANHHYGPVLADRIGQALATEIDLRLKSSADDATP